ncbi:MAG: PepSY-associated TM helix domain-containing protein [Actinocatenispora sp.]
MTVSDLERDVLDTERVRPTGPRPSRWRRSRLGRWLRRRPVRRTLVVTHRWTSLVLGLALLAETTSGAIVLYQAEYFRATHASFYTHTASAHPLGPSEAFDVVQRAHPDFDAAWVSRDKAILVVGDSAYANAYSVDPGSGHINGHESLTGGPMGFLTNLHDCGLTCEGYPGYLPALVKPVPTLGISALTGVTWGGLTLVILGLLMVLLAISGAIIWWPSFAKFSHGWRVRAGRGRFARDYDLHNVIGIVAVPFILMWGVTGAAFEMPAVENAWLTMTGGKPVSADLYSFTPHHAAKGTHRIGAAAATAAALDRTPGHVTYLATPSKDYDYYEISLANGYDPYGHRLFYNGDVTVYVDAHDAGHTKVVGLASDEPTANAFYDKVFEASHFGWMVNGWWRIIWFAFGLAPLALGLTGLSTWLVRRRVKKRRRARRAPATAAA